MKVQHRTTRRQILAGVAAATAASAFPGFAAPAAMRVSRDGSGYASLGAAIAAAPSDATQPFVIAIAPGQWRERVVIDKPFIRLVGESRDGTVLVNDRYAGVPGPTGKPVGTFDTATLIVTAPDFSASNLTIANDFDYPNRAKGSGGSQAVALAVQGEADRSLFDNVRLTGYQDTLYTDKGRCLFRNCDIEGSVDFIFGQGRALFERCTIKSRGQGYVAAPDTDIHQLYGLVFNACKLIKGDGVAPQTVALGRPWRHTRHFDDGVYGDPDNVGAAAYIACWMDDHIEKDGWASMGYNAKGGGRASLSPQEARFFEYDSQGPGAVPASPTRRMMTAQQAQDMLANVLDGWAPA